MSLSFKNWILVVNEMAVEDLAKKHAELKELEKKETFALWDWLNSKNGIKNLDPATKTEALGTYRMILFKIDRDQFKV